MNYFSGVTSTLVETLLYLIFDMHHLQTNSMTCRTCAVVAGASGVATTSLAASPTFTAGTVSPGYSVERFN